MNLFSIADTIRTKVPREELLAGLAEEAAELAQAALKYRRALDGTNPTPVTVQEAEVALHEEIADVSLYLAVLNMLVDATFPSKLIAKRMVEKLTRWAKRLQEAKV